MDNLYKDYYSLLNEYLNDLDEGLTPTLTVDNLINLLRNLDDYQIDCLIEEFGSISELKRIQVKSLLTHASDRLPFQITYSESQESISCSISQFAVPIVIQFDNHEPMMLDTEIPSILIQLITDDLKEMLNLADEDSLIVNERILNGDQISLSVKEKFLLPECLINDGYIPNETESFEVVPMEGGTVVYLYALAVRANDVDFKGFKVDSLFMEPSSILKLRDSVSKHLKVWFERKKLGLEAFCGIPGTIPVCIEAAKATQREIRFLSYFQRSIFSQYEDILAVINHNETEGIILRLYSNNQCILAFSYGIPLIYNRAGEYLDHELILAMIRAKVTERILQSSSPTNASSINDFIDQPLIGVR